MNRADRRIQLKDDFRWHQLAKPDETECGELVTQRNRHDLPQAQGAFASNYLCLECFPLDGSKQSEDA